MSACFTNILTAARMLASISDAPLYAGSEFFLQLRGLKMWNEAREAYYSDEASRRIFDWVQQYRAIASFYGSRIPIELANAPYTKEEWGRLEQEAAAMTSGFVEGDYLLDRIDTFLLEAYTLPGLCEALPGDTVLDCGAFSGNTSLYFSRKVGEAGHVYGFEASPQTFAVYARNMAALSNVTPVQAAVHETCGVLSFSGSDAGAHIVEGGKFAVPAVSLDAFAKEHALARVDFIKMDIEGAEEAALIGAREIIQKFRPKMALSAYHKGGDLLALPRRILSFAPGYTFALRHFSDCVFETVLYCMPGPDSAAKSLDSPPASVYTEPSPLEYTALFTALLPFCEQAFSHISGLQEEASKARVIEPNMKRIAEALNDSLALADELGEANKRLTLENMAMRKVMRKNGDEADVFPQEA